MNIAPRSLDPVLNQDTWNEIEMWDAVVYLNTGPAVNQSTNILDSANYNPKLCQTSTGSRMYPAN